MKKQFFLIFSYLFVFHYIYSQEAIVNGSVENGANKEVRIYSYGDLLNYDEIFLTKSNINKDGSFTIKVKTDRITMIFLKIDFYKTSFYIEPGKTYFLKIDSLNYSNNYEAANPFIKAPYLAVTRSDTNSNELNTAIEYFNMMYNDLIVNNIIELMKKRNRKIINDFIVYTDSAFKNFNHTFFKVYKEYKIAVLEETMYIETKASLFNKYFYKREIHTHNDAYMEFFNNYFTKFFTNLTLKITYSDLEAAINEQNSYNALLDTLGKDSILQNELLREMVMIKGLGELYFTPGFKKENILSILINISDKSKFSENRKMATTLVKKLNKYPIGHKAYDFKLKDKNGNLITLSQYKGRYVYLFFFNTLCNVCISEMELLNDLKTKHASILDIIGISIDLEPLNLKYFLDKKTYKFPILHFDYNYNIIDNFFVKNLPFFVLINPDGKIIQIPTNKPSEDFSKIFESELGK